MQLIELLNKKRRIHWYSALILVYLFINVGMMLNPANDIPNILYYYFFVALVGISAFFIFYSSFANKVRLGLFSVMAVLLALSLMLDLYFMRGHIGANASDVLEGLPFCHIAIVNELISLPLTKTFMFPGKLEGHYASIYSMIIILFWATILIGKGWCSWGCFYGGWDSFFSSVRKKPLVKISDKTSKKLRLIPYAFLITLAISSFAFFTPVFCTYLCPFKTITEFEQVTSFISWVVFLISVSSFFIFCIVTPIFFGRRVWCAYLCPYGALQGLVGRIFKIFKLKIDKDKCVNCKKCINACKTCGITESSLEKKQFTYNCSLCSACIEACTKKAISVTAFGIKDSPKELLERMTERLPKNKAVQGVRSVVLNIVDDILQPQSFLYFFALAVLFTFFEGFFFNSITFLYKLFGG